MTKSWAQAKPDHEYHHMRCQGHRRARGFGTKRIANRAAQEIRTGGLAERGGDHGTLTRIQAVANRVRNAVVEVNQEQNITSYWVRMGFIPRQGGHPRAGHLGGQHYIGDG